MQRTMNPMPKHPTYAHRPTPTLQLLSKLSKFQGERKDIVNKAPQEILFTTDTSDSPINHQSNDLLRQYQERGEERKIQQQVQKEYVAYFDPNFKPEDPTTTAEQKSHRYKYNSHMNSSVGKLFQNNDQRENPDDNAVEEQKFQSKRMGTQKVSNFNNTIIGGQPPEEQWQTTQHLMNNGEDPLNAKRNNRKKIVQKFEPELFVSPITGEPIAEYGTWKDDIQNQSRVKPNQEKDNEEDLMLDDPILQKLKSQLSLRGAKGIIGLGRIFRIMDDDGSNTLSFQEFKKAMKEFGMSLSDTETILLFKKFDKQNTGAITYNNFLTTIAGALNKRRTRLVNMAFEIMDQDGNGYLELSDLAGRYNGKRHPDVISGKKTEDQVLLEFLDTFTVGQNDDQKVTKQEFQNYYAAISASIDRDDYFELMIRNAWHISGGEGEAENSSNRRVLVTKSDGTQDVVEIKNDLGLDIKDTKEVLKRLKQQGVDAIKVSTANDASDPMSNPKGKLSRNKPAGKFGFSAPRGDKADPTLNPSIAPSPGVKLLIDRVKKALKGRGVNSYFELQRRFKIMDDDNSGNISYQEFKKAIKEIQSLHDLSDNDIRSMFAYFDSDGSGFIDFNEFIVGIRDPMNEKRLFLVKKAYNRLDKDGNGTIDIQDVINVYDTSKHPEVIAKRKTKNQVLTEFLANFEVGGTVDGKVTTDEFINYYNNISASIDNDNYFELMICNAWHITATEDETGKKSKTNNSANLRVMVTNSQGIEEVITLDNDLGINNTNKNDIKLLYSRLREQGVDDIYAINGKIIKVINVNGVEIITTIGDTSLLNKEDANVNYNPKANAPNVLKAPPVRRPQSASAVVSAQNRRPVAGVPELNVNKVQPTVKASSSNIPVNSRDLSNNILAGLNKRKEVNQKIQEENIAGNTLLGVLRVQLLTKGVNGIVDLQRKFQEFDSNHNAIIDLMEFRMIFQSLQLAFSEDQVETLFHYLDKDGSEGIDYYELLEGLRGPINPKILMLVHQIFDRLDQGNRNAITPDVLLQNYRASRHPEVMTGNLAEEDVMQEFLNTFDVGTVQAGIITRDEFVRYYHNVYMVINDDDYMELILRRVWNFNDGDDIEDLVTPRSASSKAAGRIRNAKDFAHEYWGDVSNTPVRRPSTGSGVRNTNNFPQKNSNEMIYIQGNNQFTNVPSVGDQSLPPSRPKTASQAKGGRTYQIMGGNGTGRNVSSSSQAYSNQTVTPQMIEEKANAIRRDAILEFNAGNFKDALEYFKLVLQLLQSIYPANHPECVKAEKSILLTQRKIQQTR